jgi:hypothetical protein
MKEDLNNQQRQLIDAMDLKIAWKLVSEMSNTFINWDDIIHLSKEWNSWRNEKSSKTITKFNEKRSAIYNTGKKTVENAN